MNLREYKPVNPESQVFLQDISDLLDEYRECKPNNFTRHVFKYTDTLTGVEGPLQSQNPEDFRNKAIRMLGNFHKLWNVDYRKRDIFLTFWEGGLRGKVGYDVTWGIGGDIFLWPSDSKGEDHFVEYKLCANGVLMEITYAAKEISRIPGLWTLEDAVTIHLSKE